MREVNKEAVLLALCSKTFTSRVIIFRFVVLLVAIIVLIN